MIPIGIEPILVRPYWRIAVRPERKVVLQLLLARRFISFRCSDHGRTLIRSSCEDSVSVRVCGEPSGVPRLSCDIYSVIRLPTPELDEKRSTSPGVHGAANFVHTAHQLMVGRTAFGMSRSVNVGLKFLPDAGSAITVVSGIGLPVVPERLRRDAHAASQPTPHCPCNSHWRPRNA